MKSKLIKTVLTILFVSINFNYLHSQQILKDINPGSDDGAEPYPIFYKGKFYFSGGISETNRELWVSDGTESGTKVFKELIAGTEAGSPEKFRVLNDYLYFMDSQGRTWRTDGTQENTIIMRDNNYFIYPVVEFNGTTIFNDKSQYTRDWIIKGGYDNLPIDTLTEGIIVSNSIVYNDELYFAHTMNYRNESTLWKTDGTELGTHSVLGDEITLTNISSLKNYKDKFVFSAFSSDYGQEVFISDGTISGTSVLKDINPLSDNSDPHSFNISGDYLYFIADDGVHGSEVWRSDGTEGGTHLYLDAIEGFEDGSRSIFNVDSIICVSCFNNSNILFNTDSVFVYLNEKFPDGSSSAGIFYDSNSKPYIKITNTIRTGRYTSNTEHFYVESLNDFKYLTRYKGPYGKYEFDMVSHGRLFDTAYIGVTETEDYGVEFYYLPVENNYKPDIISGQRFSYKNQTEGLFLGKIKTVDKDNDELFLKILDKNVFYLSHDSLYKGKTSYHPRAEENSHTVKFIVEVWDGYSKDTSVIHVDVIENLKPEIITDTLFLSSFEIGDTVGVVKVEDPDSYVFDYYLSKDSRFFLPSGIRPNQNIFNVDKTSGIITINDNYYLDNDEVFGDRDWYNHHKMEISVYDEYRPVRDTIFIEMVRNSPPTYIELISSYDITISPNPATDFVFVEAPTESNIVVSITDLSGKVIKNNIIDSIINISDLSSGCYFFIFKDYMTGISVTKKLIKN